MREGVFQGLMLLVSLEWFRLALPFVGLRFSVCREIQTKSSCFGSQDGKTPSTSNILRFFFGLSWKAIAVHLKSQTSKALEAGTHRPPMALSEVATDFSKGLNGLSIQIAPILNQNFVVPTILSSKYVATFWSCCSTTLLEVMNWPHDSGTIRWTSPTKTIGLLDSPGLPALHRLFIDSN